MKFKDAIYELKPYALLALGVYAISSSEPSPILVGSVLLLLGCASWILRMRFKARKGTGVEALFYELQPFLYLALAMYVFTFKRSSTVAVGSAVILIFCALIILNWRFGRR